ncbi:MAG: glycosyl transferase [Bacteroidales bacterium]|nr:glycosyl transferase [Bacteroidales bacterium]
MSKQPHKEGIKQPKNVNTKGQKLWRAISDPWWLGWFLLRKASSLIKNDKTFIKWEYFFQMKKFPNLENPATFNDKLQCMKLYDQNPLYSKVVDKSLSKEYVAEVLGSEEYIIPTLGVWDKWEDIDFDALPNEFVLKTTHDSGGVAIVKDKHSDDLAKAKSKIEKSLSHNFFLEHREWPYKAVKPRIIAEQLIHSLTDGGLRDYKFFCFNGEPRMLLLASDRARDVRFDYFDMDFNHLPFVQGHPWANVMPERPANFEQMKDLARRLSAAFPQVRVDLYSVGDKIYFGELTFFHFSGNVPFVPAAWDERIGEWWTNANYLPREN